MTAEMTPWERIRAALTGDPVDRPPISLWRHFPLEDETSAGLAAATVRWQQAYRFDLVKFSPTGTYAIEDWGARTTYEPNDEGVRTVTHWGVRSPEDWARLCPLDVTQGYLGRQIDALSLTVDALAADAPILMTLFSPLTTARKLAGDAVFEHMRCAPDLVLAGLDTIARTTVALAQESMRRGAAGAFFATQCASSQWLSETEYRRFGEAFDRPVLEAIRGDGKIVLLHAHGQQVLFDVLLGYSIDALNWHDRAVGPSMDEMRKRFAGLLVGGIDERATLLRGSESDVRTQVQDAIRRTEGRGCMIGPGCVVPIHAPEANLRAACAEVMARG